MTSGGELMTVGQNAVTPCRASVSATRVKAVGGSAAEVRSAPPAPFTCRSIRPGAIQPSSTTRSPASGRGAGCRPTMRPSATSTRDGGSSCPPVSTLPHNDGIAFKCLTTFARSRVLAFARSLVSRAPAVNTDGLSAPLETGTRERMNARTRERANARTREQIKMTHARPLHRHVRLELSQRRGHLGRHVLPAQARRQGQAQLLRPVLQYGRDQQLVLPPAESVRRTGLGGQSARGLPLHRQAVAEVHASQDVRSGDRAKLARAGRGLRSVCRGSRSPKQAGSACCWLNFRRAFGRTRGPSNTWKT